MTFTAHIRQEADALFEASFHHPFVRALGDGTLDEAKFRHYVMQDSYYLNQFSKVQAKGVTLAPTMELASRFLTHASSMRSDQTLSSRRVRLGCCSIMS
ncbi:hypothetical protein [Exiguobacterium sp. SH5S4]|uniref:hypothetical protein n=1 Tax=Exiguobacterium sp. SH5S4 TaxID=2510961 RepID=UPI0035199A33